LKTGEVACFHGHSTIGDDCYAMALILVRLVYAAHWHSARWAWNGYQPGLGSITRPGRI